jgi:hypothetical protein
MKYPNQVYKELAHFCRGHPSNNWRWFLTDAMWVSVANAREQKHERRTIF